jgi:predicted nucleotidyltransferase
MPVRSLHTSVLRWPDQSTVHSAVAEWTRSLIAADARVARVGYAGSYARGNWGVGSDVDIVILVRETKEPFVERAGAYDATSLPVPADVLVYTEDEWRGTELRRSLHPVVWIDG